MVAGNELVTLMATLKDVKGAPVPKTELTFLADAEFAGTKNQMTIGVAKTDANGVAFLDYRPLSAGTQQTITVRFEGAGVYAESQQSLSLQKFGAGTAFKADPVGLEPLRDAAPWMLFGIVLAVWVTFAFVISQVWGIFRERAPR